MSERVEVCLNRATEEQIADHLTRCDADFVPPLSDRVDIAVYARKIAARAVRFEAWASGELIGLVASYCNDEEGGVAFVTSVSVLKDWRGRGVASRLMERCVRHAEELGLRRVELEVDGRNARAIRLYEEKGFMVDERRAGVAVLNLGTGGR